MFFFLTKYIFKIMFIMRAQNIKPEENPRVCNIHVHCVKITMQNVNDNQGVKIYGITDYFDQWSFENDNVIKRIGRKIIMLQSI